MAGMFYSIQEAAERLNKTEDEVKQIAQDGKLREFRDGPNLLFKVEEVEALISQEEEAKAEEIAEPQEVTETPESDETMEISELEVGEAAEVSEKEQAEESPELEEVTEAPEVEEIAEAPDMEEAAEIPEPEEIAETPEPEESMEILELEDVMEAPKPEDVVETPEESAMKLLDEDKEKEDKEKTEEEKPIPPGSSGSSEILLAPETGAPNEFTDADTALTGQGTSVLGETDSDYEITEDTLAETTFAAGPAGSSPEAENSRDRWPA